MNARDRGPMKFLGVAVTALALIIALHVGSFQSVSRHGEITAGATLVDVRLAASTNLFVPGTGNPGETGSTQPGNEWVIAYPATQPVTGDYPGSVRAGVAGLNDAVSTTPPGSSLEVAGYSQGAHVVTEWAAQPGVLDDRDVTLVTTGDPCTARTGILMRSAEARAVAGHCSSLPPGVNQVVIVQACDPIANFPEKIDLLTVANALAGYTYCHGGGYTSDQLNRPDISTYQDGSVTYQVIPAGPTSPLVQALHQGGVFLPESVETGIDAAVAQSGPGPRADSGVPSVVTPTAAPLWVPPPPEAAVPTGNVAAVAEVVTQYVPAPEVEWAAAQIQASPLGAVLNGLPPLPFG